jgi:hypothetical protein
MKYHLTCCATGIKNSLSTDRMTTCTINLVKSGYRPRVSDTVELGASLAALGIQK